MELELKEKTVGRENPPYLCLFLVHNASVSTMLVSHDSSSLDVWKYNFHSVQFGTES